MESRKIVFRETGIVLIGEVLGVAAMLGVFALLGAFDTKVLLGGAVGGLITVANYFAMAVCASLAADRAEQQNVKGGQALMHTSYLIRMVVLFVLLIACAKSGFFNVIALAVPIIFPRFTITFAEFFRKKGD